MVGNNSIRCPTDWLDFFRFSVPLRKFEASGTGIVRALSIALPRVAFKSSTFNQICMQAVWLQSLTLKSLGVVHHISSVLADLRHKKAASCGPCALALSLSLQMAVSDCRHWMTRGTEE